jgi:ribosome-binding protein aMBF1 (putative translation factor)
MVRSTLTEVTRRRLSTMTTAERAAFEETRDATTLALSVGQSVRDAREAAGLTQRELASRMRTSQAAIARLEAGGVGATLTTLQRAADALGLTLNVQFSAGD